MKKQSKTTMKTPKPNKTHLPTIMAGGKQPFSSSVIFYTSTKYSAFSEFSPLFFIFDRSFAEFLFFSQSLKWQSGSRSTALPVTSSPSSQKSSNSPHQRLQRTSTPGLASPPSSPSSAPSWPTHSSAVSKPFSSPPLFTAW